MSDIVITRTYQCPRCDGDGEISVGSALQLALCNVCDGRGVVTEDIAHDEYWRQGDEP